SSRRAGRRAASAAGEDPAEAQAALAAVAVNAGTSSPPRRAARPATENGFLTVNSVPWGAVYVDGKRIANETPLYRLPISAGTHRVTVFDPTRQVHSQPRQVVIKAGRTSEVAFRF
ncbi:MAG: PEGA domain-containing protein, partial [Pseudomonadota bacterium]